LSSSEKRILAVGLDFKIHPRKLSFCNYFLYFEKICHQLESMTGFLDKAKCFPTIKTLSNKLFYNFKPHKLFSPLISTKDIILLKRLRQDENIVICRPDKGNGVVLLDRDNYRVKLLFILGDGTKFKELPFDAFNLIIKIEDKINYCLRTLKTKGFEFYNEVYTSGTHPGLLYGLPKIHKMGIPLRPILSAIGTPAYGLSKFLVPILKPATTNQYTLSDSFEFVDFVAELQFDSCFMTSFDVESLFTNIPINETRQIIVNFLFQSQDRILNLNKRDFLKLLKVATDDSVFFYSMNGFFNK